MMCMFFSAEVGKTVDRVLMTHPLVGFADCNQTVLLPMAVKVFAFPVFAC